MFSDQFIAYAFLVALAVGMFWSIAGWTLDNSRAERNARRARLLRYYRLHGITAREEANPTRLNTWL
jgi:hypothetical protein